MEIPISEQLGSLAEEDYRRFAAKLLPGIPHILGVRLPKLRALAKKIARSDWRTYLDQATEDSFEEVMLQGMVIGCLEADTEEILSRAAEFVPKIDNWSVNDSFCSGLKLAEREPERVWDFLQPYLSSETEFALRFGVVMLLNFYVTPAYIDRVLARLDALSPRGYYAQMAAAWALSVCFIRFPQQTMPYLQNSRLDRFTYNKALQKITESLQVDAAAKAMIRAMKRK